MANSQSTIGYRYEEEYIQSSRRLKMFTCSWLPTGQQQEPKALVFLCHGYGMECSISMESTGTRLARAGFAVYGIDYEGHGKSAGLLGYVPSFDRVVDDCSEYYTRVCEQKENKKKQRFLLGESMGGAVALLLHRKKPNYWDGAVLVAPMCKIADELKPHPVVVRILTQLCKVIPTWKIIPTKDIIDVAFKDPEYRNIVRSNPYCYKGKPRLKTGNELLRVSMEIEATLDQVSLPFIIVHGGDDVVTDPSVSQLLYETAASKDKTYKLYPGMWHALTSAESPDNMNSVFADIIGWLGQRAGGRNDCECTRGYEVEKKSIHDPVEAKPRC